MLIKSALHRAITSREMASMAVAGLSVLGSERWPTTSRPP
jgi:hypothetical protein